MKNKLKELGFSRAEDIINTANPKLSKKYRKLHNGILFWISEKPYRIYFIKLDGWQPEVQLQHFSYFIDLLEKRGFHQHEKDS